MERGPNTEVQDKGGVATAEGGIVMLDGPDGVAVSKTPQAAMATGRALIDAAGEALAQKSG